MLAILSLGCSYAAGEGINNRLYVSAEDQYGYVDVSTNSPLVLDEIPNCGYVAARPNDGSLILQNRIKLSARREGSGELLSWKGVTLGVRFGDGRWSMYCISDDGTSWLNTDFSLASADEGNWISVDIVRLSGKLDGYYLVFANGSLVSSVSKCPSCDVGAEAHYKPLDFAEYEIGGVTDSDSYPDYVVRALRMLDLNQNSIENLLDSGDGRVDSVSHRRAVQSDEKRMCMRNFPDFMVSVDPGDLSYGEVRWFMTQTVNREYYDYTPMFDIVRAQQDACKLALEGADYLPTIESRSWGGDVVYENWSDNYIEKIFGYIVTDVEGDYRFFVSGDDQAAFYLGGDSSTDDLSMVAYTVEPTSRREWNKFDTQRSGLIHLGAFTAYYFELWHVETTGNDHLALAWRKTGDGNAMPSLIPSICISSCLGGVPGSSTRDIYPPDPSLISLPAEGSDSDEDVTTAFMTLSSTGLLMGNAPITSSDFSSSTSLYHAYEGAGLGSTSLTTAGFPTLYSGLYATSVYYVAGTSNPQVFYNYTVGLYMNFYVSPSVVMNYVVSEQPFMSYFQSGFDSYWSNDTSGDTHNWYTYAGKTSTTSTGPSVDHTYGTTSGYYIYFNTASGYAYTSGNTAILLGPSILPGDRGTVVSFYYHMYGTNIGSLELDKKVSGAWSKVWGLSGQQQTSSAAVWKRADVFMPPTNGLGVIFRIKATASGGSLGEIAVDDIAVYDFDEDTDGDGLLDGTEYYLGTAVRTANTLDSDGDGLPCWLEVSLSNAGFTTTGVKSDSSALSSSESISSSSGTVKLFPGQPL